MHAGQTARRGRLKFAHGRDDVTGVRLCRVCVRRGAGVARGARWKTVNFPLALTWEILRSKRAERRNALDTGTLPGEYLENRASDRHGVSTGV